jgi:FkbM family methyltransferase
MKIFEQEFMLGSGRLKKSLRAAIGAHRRSAPVRALHGFARFVESAYANEGSSFHENGESLLLKKLAASGFRTAFDVGANFGDWSDEALAAWPQCHVHAFEVAPATFQELSKRLCGAAQQGRVTLNGMGLSDRPGAREMYYYPDHPELTSEVARHGNYRAVPFEARLTAGDEYCDVRNIEEIDFLKIDVEGAESLVLKGFQERLSSRRIHCIQFEYGAFSTQTKFLLGDYFNLLGPAYRIGKIFPNYVDFRDYDWRMEDFRFCNYCCVSNRRDDLRAILAA